ncbi:MAG: hypothetical protein RR482_02295 [Clostridia bacterium]
MISNRYRFCCALLRAGNLTHELLDVYLAAGRLTAEQYAELDAALPAPAEGEPGE